DSKCCTLCELELAWAASAVRELPRISRRACCSASSACRLSPVGDNAAKVVLPAVTTAGVENGPVGLVISTGRLVGLPFALETPRREGDIPREGPAFGKIVVCWITGKKFRVFEEQDSRCCLRACG